MKFLILFACLILVSLPDLIHTQCNGPNGTTKNFETIFLGRCENFLNVLYKSNCDIQAANISCNTLLNNFKSAVIGKDPCSVTVDSWKDFLKAGRHKIPANKSLFWSGTNALAHEISTSQSYFTLEDTLTGYVANELRWCSSKGKTAFDSVCPVDCVVKDNSFWVAASIDFAQKASGIVTVLVNNTVARGGAAANFSIFMKYEIHNLDPTKVKEVRIVLASTPGSQIYETCSKPVTLTNAQNILAAKKIPYKCFDYIIFDNFDLRSLLCYYNSESATCKASQKVF